MSVILTVFAGFCEVFPMGTEVTSPPNQLAAFVEVGYWSHKGYFIPWILKISSNFAMILRLLRM